MPTDPVGLGTAVLLHLQRPHPLPPGTQSRRSDTHLGGLALPPDLGPHGGHAPAPYPHLVLVAQCHLVTQHPTRGWGHDAGPATPCLLMSQSAAGNQTAEVGWDKGGPCWGASLLGPSPWGSTAHSKGKKLCPALKAWSWVRDNMGQTPAAPGGKTFAPQNSSGTTTRGFYGCSCHTAAQGAPKTHWAPQHTCIPTRVPCIWASQQHHPCSRSCGTQGDSPCCLQGGAGTDGDRKEVACSCVLVGMNLRDGHRYPPPPLHRIFYIYI